MEPDPMKRQWQRELEWNMTPEERDAHNTRSMVMVAQCRPVTDRRMWTYSPYIGDRGGYTYRGATPAGKELLAVPQDSETLFLLVDLDTGDAVQVGSV